MDKPEILDKMITMLRELPDYIYEINEFECGANIISSDRAFDIALYSGFDSLEDLDVYRIHPKHLKVVEFFKKVVLKT